jgi:hypothetical protein
MRDISEMFDDPTPPDENDPEFIEESFEIHKDQGDKPEDLVGATQEYRDAYAKWLNSR